MEFSKKIHSKNERKGNHMAKLKKWIGNLKVAEKLKVYRMAVLVMTAFFRTGGTCIDISDSFEYTSYYGSVVSFT